MPLHPADVDHRSGYCAATKTFHSLRPPLLLPPPDCPISFPSFMFSLLPATLPSRPALVDAGTGETVPYPTFLSRIRALAAALRTRLGVSRGDVAFVLAPPGVHLPMLYYALMDVGAVVSPANPALTAGEISGLVALSGPSVAFAVKATIGKLPPGLNTVLLDSARFLTFFHEPHDEDGRATRTDVVIHQSDPAAILYSSGTTGRAKAVVLTHRNLMASNATRGPATAEVLMLAVPIFHIYGFTFCFRVAPSANTIVLHTTRKFDAREVLAVVGRFGVTQLALAPPTLLGIVRAAEEDETLIAHGATLQAVNCGGAPISTELLRRFFHKFPDVCLHQVGFAAASS
jgi:acyl-CoA synthetase (AMP-forming)/AMP-acid ligase II